MIMQLTASPLSSALPVLAFLWHAYQTYNQLILKFENSPLRKLTPLVFFAIKARESYYASCKGATWGHPGWLISAPVFLCLNIFMGLFCESIYHVLLDAWLLSVWKDMYVNYSLARMRRKVSALWIVSITSLYRHMCRDVGCVHVPVYLYM